LIVDPLDEGTWEAILDAEEDTDHLHGLVLRADWRTPVASLACPQQCTSGYSEFDAG
jgi:hypothetical protein